MHINEIDTPRMTP